MACRSSYSGFSDAVHQGCACLAGWTSSSNFRQRAFESIAVDLPVEHGFKKTDASYGGWEVSAGRVALGADPVLRRSHQIGG